jgi:hypothetical protein
MRYVITLAMFEEASQTRARTGAPSSERAASRRASRALEASAPQRLALVFFAVALLWGGVFWALH